MLTGSSRQCRQPGKRRVQGYLAALLATATLVWAGAIQAAETVTLAEPRMAHHEGYLRLVFDLSDNVKYEMLPRQNHRRVDLLVLNATLDGDLQGLELGGSLLTEASSSPVPDNSLRLSFNTNTPVTPLISLLKPYKARGYRLVIDFYHAGDINSQAGAPAAAAAAAASQSVDEQESTVVFSGTWEQEAALRTDDFSGQKFEAMVHPRWDIRLPDDWRLTAIARLRLDLVGDLGPFASRPPNYSGVNGPWYNDEYAEISLREFYFDKNWEGSSWRLGKQQVVWGQADGIKVLDVVNPQSYREFIVDDFDNSRIPLWMVNAELALSEDSSLQVLWIPDTSYHELAETGTPFAFTSDMIIPSAPDNLPVRVLKPDKPDDPIEDSDFGLRYSSFAGGWDITLNYLYHYQDFPVLYQQLRQDDGELEGVVSPEYERNNLLGATLSNVFGDLTLRAELAYNTDTFHLSDNLADEGIADSAEFASVLGVDWRLGNDAMLSGQWFLSHLADYDSDIVRDRSENNLSLMYRQSFDNSLWTLHALGLYSTNHGDSWINVKLSYLLQSNVEIWVGGDFFQGDSDGIFGQFSSEDRLLFGMELGF